MKTSCPGPEIVPLLFRGGRGERECPTGSDDDTGRSSNCFRSFDDGDPRVVAIHAIRVLIQNTVHLLDPIQRFVEAHGSECPGARHR